MKKDPLKIPGQVTEHSKSATTLVLSGTFTLDPLLPPLELVLRDMAASWPVALAPYRQIFQELVDPRSESAQNKKGVNILLIRVEDWLPQSGEAVAGKAVAGDAFAGDALTTTAAAHRSTPAEIVDDLLRLLEDRTPSWPAGALVGICPSLRPEAMPFEARLREGIARLRSGHLRLLPLPEIALLSAGAVHDPQSDRLANVPYTPLAFAALARDVARASHALRTARPKVIALDCDNTLWDGVVGEDGVEGVRISRHRRAFHELLRSKRQAGVLLCLASKNVEEDVLDVFRRRSDLGLGIEDLVAWKVNWQPKSVNLRELAEELNLGLDSFVFLDDNPVEIAEMQAACPEVLSLLVPTDATLLPFLQQIWPLDVHTTTEEDRRRTELYRENLARDRFQKASSHLSDFLQGLGLNVRIHPPQPDQLARTAQLTQRTNQFNFTTVRRTEGELAAALANGLHCRVVEVSDRFGDYGLVGVLLFALQGDTLQVDTFLLSCRVLGRGVEHAMLRHLGEVAKEEHAPYVDAPFEPTAKNAPAARFLAGCPGLLRDQDAPGDQRRHYVMTAEAAADFSYQPAESTAPGSQDSLDGDVAKATIAFTPVSEIPSVTWHRFAHEHATPEATLAKLAGRRSQPADVAAIVPPRNAREAALQVIWREALGLDIGVEDDFFSSGGTSLLAVTVFARIEREMGLRLPLALLVECPTIASLAGRFEGTRDLGSLVVLQRAERPFSEVAPLFLVHDADGETLLYRNLARRLGGRRSVYGLQPRAQQGAGIVHTRIEEMARHYVEEMRKVRTRGPYLLGGLCAGGVLAYEMARQLENVGEAAHLVALFDAADVAAAPRPHLESGRRLSRVKAALRAAPLRALPAVIAKKALGFSTYGVESRVRRARDGLAISTLRFCLDYGVALPSWARNLSVRAVYTAAEAIYKPRYKVREDIVLFRATSGEGAEEPYVQRYADPKLGWQARTAKEVRVFDVPGGHGSMLQEPHVGVIADHLGTYLDTLADQATESLAPQRASS